MPRSRSRGRCRDRDPVDPDPHWADWEAAVILQVNRHWQEHVTNPAEALSFLLVQWRGERDDAYETARAACSKVFRRRISPEEARTAFISFARCVGILDQLDAV